MTRTLNPESAAEMRSNGRRTVGVTAVAAVAAIIGGWFNPAAFFHAYLFAALACLHPALGCLPLTFIHRMTGGAWGKTLAPSLAAGRGMIPWVLLFCVPLFFGLRHLFPWAAPDTLSPGALALLAKHPHYFSRAAFGARALGYAVSFFVLLWMARRGAAAPWTGPVGMMLYVVTVYLLGVDWVVSLEPGWSSTAFPVIFMAGQLLAGLALCIAATILLVPSDPAATGGSGVWKDLGNLMLGTLMFWAYVAYGQFLVVWSGNLPREAAWYLHRNAGAWHWVIIALAVFHLFVPVMFLLSNRTKRRTGFSAGVALLVVFGQAVYLYWLVLPTFNPAGNAFHWLDAVVPLALDALWLACFLGLHLKTTEDTADA